MKTSVEICLLWLVIIKIQDQSVKLFRKLEQLKSDIIKKTFLVFFSLWSRGHRGSSLPNIFHQHIRMFKYQRYLRSLFFLNYSLPMKFLVFHPQKQYLFVEKNPRWSHVYELNITWRISVVIQYLIFPIIRDNANRQCVPIKWFLTSTESISLHSDKSKYYGVSRKCLVSINTYYSLLMKDSKQKLITSIEADR